MAWPPKEPKRDQLPRTIILICGFYDLARGLIGAEGSSSRLKGYWSIRPVSWKGKGCVWLVSSQSQGSAPGTTHTFTKPPRQPEMAALPEFPFFGVIPNAEQPMEELEEGEINDAPVFQQAPAVWEDDILLEEPWWMDEGDEDSGFESEGQEAARRPVPHVAYLPSRPSRLEEWLVSELLEWGTRLGQYEAGAEVGRHQMDFFGWAAVRRQHNAGRVVMRRMTASLEVLRRGTDRSRFVLPPRPPRCCDFGRITWTRPEPETDEEAAAWSAREALTAEYDALARRGAPQCLKDAIIEALTKARGLVARLSAQRYERRLGVIAERRVAMILLVQQERLEDELEREEREDGPVRFGMLRRWWEVPTEESYQWRARHE